MDALKADEAVEYSIGEQEQHCVETREGAAESSREIEKKLVVTAAEGAVVNKKSSAVHASEEQLHCNVSLHT